MALHLKFALNLDSLVGRMIEDVGKEWDTPFDAPTILFSEYKLEQWFRLRWMEKKGVLANLNKASLDNFLFKILGGGQRDESGKVRKKLSVNLLRNAVIAYLKELAENGQDAVGEKLSNRIAAYLFSRKSEIDESRLFDLANKMAALFLEYEISRPSRFWTKEKPGILDCWKQGDLKPFFRDKDGKEVENEKWERELYSAIFHNVDGDSLLTRAFEQVNPDSRFLTLPFMFEACKENGIPHFHFDSRKPVFILGLSGMGQFYRVVLREFSKTHEVFAYIQNPCMAFWEDLEDKKSPFEKWALDKEEPLKPDENELLRDWGRAGRDSIKIWCMNDDYDFSFPEEEEKFSGNALPDDTLLHEIQRMVANRTNQTEFKPKDKDESLTLTGAPNRVREVEAVHSRICKLLNHGAEIRDILVVSPNLPEYRAAIHQVFDQKERGDENGVHLPFVIVDSATKKSLVGEALENLFAIKRNGALNRPNFFALMRNPVVQAARGISPDEVSNWEAWVSGMGVFRDHECRNNRKEDWLFGEKRLLLSRISDSTIGEYTPYSDMESENDAELNRFADAVESLESWIRMEPPVWSEKAFSRIRNFLSGWLSMPNAPKELFGESIVFQNVLSSLDDLKYQFAAGAKEISWDMVSMSLQESVETSSYSFGSLFVNGITFMKFIPNRTIPVKHLFFMGANAKDFPGSKSYDSLDLRKSVPSWPGDDTAVQRNRYAFLCQLMSTIESFHISYQNAYLPKDEELYPSSVVADLQRFLKSTMKLDFKERKMEIDEKRDWEELFTNRERRNKETLSLFNKSKDSQVNEPRAESSKDSPGVNELPSRVSAYSVKRFLENPFTFRADRTLGVEDVEEDPEKEVFEPIQLGNLEKSRLLKNLLVQKWGTREDGEDLNFDALSRKGEIPPEPFGKKAWEDLNEKADFFKGKIQTHFPGMNFHPQKIELEIPKADGFSKWTLSGNVNLFAEDGDRAVVVDVKTSDLKVFHLLPVYVAALGLLAKDDRPNDLSVELSVFYSSGKVLSGPKISLSKEDARERLNRIYGAMFEEKFRKLLPVSLYTESFHSYDELWAKAAESLKYFAAKDLLDCRRAEVGGFTTKRAGLKEGPWEEWESAKAAMKSLMPEIISLAETLEEQKSNKKKKGGK